MLVLGGVVVLAGVLMAMLWATSQIVTDVMERTVLAVQGPRDLPQPMALPEEPAEEPENIYPVWEEEPWAVSSDEPPRS